MNGNNSSSMKKRKANDGRATADGTHDVHRGNTYDGGGFLSSWFGYFSGQRDGASSLGPSPTEDNTSQLDRMEVIMMRMEEKLATVESRCETLEAKCSSLENLLESTSQSTKEHIDEKKNSLCLHLDQKCNSLESRLETKVDSVHEKVERSLKFHEYNEMLVKNQSWEYSAAIHSIDYPQFDEFTMEDAQNLKSITTQMRRGEFPHEFNGNEKGVVVDMYNVDPQYIDAVNNMLLPHWREFAAALKQFTPAINVLPDDSESFFTLSNVQLNHDAMLLIKEALISKPFQKLTFDSNGDGAGMSVDTILDVVDSNKHLRKLEFCRNLIGNQIDTGHIERLCSAVHNHALVELDLYESFAPGVGDRMLASLLTIDDLKLEKLVMVSNNITSATLLADFLATNPRLKELDLDKNHLNDIDAALIATALRSNTSLRILRLDENNITHIGAESLRLVLDDDNSLNSAADSNHICRVWTTTGVGVDINWKEVQINRGRKIYSILSFRNQTLTNVNYFDNIDVKSLPNMIVAVQKYHDAARSYFNPNYDINNDNVEPLSIVYEIMPSSMGAEKRHKQLVIHRTSRITLQAKKKNAPRAAPDEWERRLASILDKSRNSLLDINAKYDRRSKHHALCGIENLHCGPHERHAIEAFQAKVNVPLSRPLSRSTDDEIYRSVEPRISKYVDDKLVVKARAIDALHDQISALSDDIRQLAKDSTRTTKA
eukprot:scaffold1377_cov125-Skeletonema_dohrnii-CCMP3373.AAC.1